MPGGHSRFHVCKMANWAEAATHDAVEIEAWRREQLARAGFSLRQAEQLAARPDIDLHAAIELVERGCQPALALRILL